jgi:hypothetical protein
VMQSNRPSLGVHAEYTRGAQVSWTTFTVSAGYRLANTNVYLAGNYLYSGAHHVERQRTRVAIDPNIRVRGNATYVGFEDVSGPIAVNDAVEVYEPESGVAGEGRITEIDGEKELVYLSVDWASLTTDHSPSQAPETPSGQILFISDAPLPPGDDADWLSWVSKPCLADVGWGDQTFWVTAPAMMASVYPSALPYGWPHPMEIRPLRVSPGSSRGVAV